MPSRNDWKQILIELVIPALARGESMKDIRERYGIKDTGGNLYLAAKHHNLALRPGGTTACECGGTKRNEQRMCQACHAEFLASRSDAKKRCLKPISAGANNFLEPRGSREEAKRRAKLRQRIDTLHRYEQNMLRSRAGLPWEHRHDC